MEGKCREVCSWIILTESELFGAFCVIVRVQLTCSFTYAQRKHLSLSRISKYVLMYLLNYSLRLNIMLQYEGHCGLHAFAGIVYFTGI